MSTTSGSSVVGERDRLGAVARLADHLEVGLGLEDQTEARPHELLVVGQQHADAHARPSRSGSLAWTRKPPSGRGPALSSPPNRPTRSLIPMSPRPPLARRSPSRASTLAIIDDLELETVGGVSYVDAGVRGTGVLERVRQRLLDDPVGREVDARRQCDRRALDRHVHG